MNVLFMGTPDFALEAIKVLDESKHNVLAAVSQPDKPKGRGHKMVAPPVKEYAVEHNIPVFQPDTLKNGELKEVLDDLKPDIIVVAAYGKILPDYVIDYPKYGCINIHASLLPKYRGAAPIQWSIAGGETVTGVTSMQMDAGLDTGDMLISAETPITDDENGESLHDKLSALGAEVLIETLKKVQDGTVIKRKQDDSLSNYAPMITKENTRIDFTKSAKEVRNLVRAMNPFPGAYTELGGKKVKIFSCEITDIKAETPGKIVKVCDDCFCISCADVAVKVCTLQLEGKKRMCASDFLKGKKLSVGDIFN